MASLLTKIKKPVRDEYIYQILKNEETPLIRKATELIENIEPPELRKYLNNYYLVKGDSKDETLDDFDKHEDLKKHIKAYIENYNLEKDGNILNVLEGKLDDIITKILTLLKTIENKPTISANFTSLTSLKDKLGHFILGIRWLKNTKTSSLGGGKYKMHSKKEILGKMRCIYKKAGDRKDRKEYIKHKGNFITLRKFREYNKQKK